MNRVRLGINIDHVATLRNARGGRNPDPVRAAAMVAAAGGDGITAHLREDRRHIVDTDIERLVAEIDLPLNFEMAATSEMLAIALRTHPHAACIVPEKRSERTTESGLDVIGQRDILAPIIDTLGAADIRVSLFVDPEPAQLTAAAAVGAPVVELHTGSYCDAADDERDAQLQRIVAAAALCGELDLECHAGHGLDFATVQPVAGIANMRELNIGHFLVGEAVFVGLDASIRRMRQLIDEARVG